MIRRNSYELKLMRECGQIAAGALKATIDSVRVGITPLELDEIAKEEIYRLGGELSYKSVPGYKYATCITINEQVVHGIPTDVVIKIGDLVSVDLAVVYKGWNTDCAWSVLVRGQGIGDRGQEDRKKFLEVGEMALKDGISKAYEGNRIGDISHAIQLRIEDAGYSVVRSLVGHGIGRNLHEEPEVPGYGKPGEGVKLVVGMTLAIEVIYAQGDYQLVLESDGWTYSTADKSLGGLFEMTVIVGKDQGEVITNWKGT